MSVSIVAPDSKTYFQDEQHLVAAFEFDKELSIKFYLDNACVATWCCCACLGAYPLIAYYSCGQANIRDQINSQYVAITIDGIKYVQEKHPTGCRLAQCDQGKASKTVPFDKITDCDIQEPAGADWCGLVPYVLSTVNIDTASGRELSLSGLRDAKGFKEMVWKMKREQGGVSAAGGGGGGGGGGGVSAHAAMDRYVGSGAAPVDERTAAEMVSLLKEQNALLKKQCELLQVIADKR